MPVDFLIEEHERRYGRFDANPSPTQLARSFHLDDTDRAHVAKRRRDHNRLGFAVQLTTVRFLGTFLANPTDVPKVVVDYVARQLGIQPALIARYAERPSTQHEHTVEIREAYGYRHFNDPPGHFYLVRWLFVRAWLSSERPSLMFDLATTWLVERKNPLAGRDDAVQAYCSGARTLGQARVEDLGESTDPIAA